MGPQASLAARRRSTTSIAATCYRPRPRPRVDLEGSAEGPREDGRRRRSATIVIVDANRRSSSRSAVAGARASSRPSSGRPRAPVPAASLTCGQGARTGGRRSTALDGARDGRAGSHDRASSAFDRHDPQTSRAGADLAALEDTAEPQADGSPVGQGGSRPDARRTLASSLPNAARRARLHEVAVCATSSAAR